MKFDVCELQYNIQNVFKMAVLCVCVCAVRYRYQSTHRTLLFIKEKIYSCFLVSVCIYVLVP